MRHTDGNTKPLQHGCKAFCAKITYQGIRR